MRLLKTAKQENCRSNSRFWLQVSYGWRVAIVGRVLLFLLFLLFRPLFLLLVVLFRYYSLLSSDWPTPTSRKLFFNLYFDCVPHQTGSDLGAGGPITAPTNTMTTPLPHSPTLPLLNGANEEVPPLQPRADTSCTFVLTIPLSLRPFIPPSPQPPHPPSFFRGARPALMRRPALLRPRWRFSSVHKKNERLLSAVFLSHSLSAAAG